MMAILPEFPEPLLADVLKHMGYARTGPAAVVENRIRDLMDSDWRLLRPQYRIRYTPLIRVGPETIHAAGLDIAAVKWADLVRRMGDPELIGAYVVTLGAAIDRRIEAAARSSYFDAWVLEAMGAAAVEYAAAAIESRLAERLSAEGYTCSRRFSPGYCGWALDTGQESLFRFLGPESIGVERLVGGAATPLKTVTAAVVAARSMPHKSPCPICRDKHCAYRLA